MEKKTAIVLGAGSRGRAYAAYSLHCPEELAIVGVAEPDAQRREAFVKTYHVPEENSCADWRTILERPRFADLVFVCTLDDMHTQPAIEAMKKGYHVLLEKPMSTTLEDCLKIERTARETGRILTVCHVLRYTSFYRTLKRLITEGAVGDISTVDQIENVGYWHQAHSFVRGNWRNSDQTTPMILAKSCHDMDIISWLIDRPCVWVSSYGGLQHFNKENAPKDAPLNCMDGCPHQESCPFYAPKIYLTGKTGWPMDVVAMDQTPEGIAKALKEGPYGRCVYHCDNNVVDHQVVIMEYEGGITASFTMTAFTERITRQLRIMGTRGEITADLGKKEIWLQPFGKEAVPIACEQNEADQFGHGGGDFGIVKNLIGLLNGEGDNLTSAKVSLQSHLMCFAAEKSRLEHRMISMKEMEE